MSGIKMNTNKTKVTVVTVTYNAEEHLEQTIKSVIEQDYPNIEYIIIDGASTDKTIDIIKRYERYITYWISEPDVGIYDAMNKGIDVATGEWINFMNAGDSFCHTNTISKVINDSEVNDDLISGDISYINNNIKRYLKAPGTINALNGMFCFHQTLFTKTSIMKQYKFSLEFKIAGDYDFVLKCFMNGFNFKFLDFGIANFIAGGFAELNPIKGRIEDMFIQSKYLENLTDIFTLSAYARFENLKPNNNIILRKLLNNLHIELNSLHLESKKIILYGFGHIGQIIYNQLKNNIVAIVDKNFKKLNYSNSTKILDVNDINNLEADYILISVLGKEKEIIDFLRSENLLTNKTIISLKI
jgi:glycosyltransferase involved in cell wall biosynthesis